MVVDECHHWPTFQLYACLTLLVGLFLCGCGGSGEDFAAPQRVYSLTQSNVSPSMSKIGGFWLKKVEPPQTATTGYIVVVKQVPPIYGPESTLRWQTVFPATLYPDLSDPNIHGNWKIYEIKLDRGNVSILVSMQEK